MGGTVGKLITYDNCTKSVNLHLQWTSVTPCFVGQKNRGIRLHSVSTPITRYWSSGSCSPDCQIAWCQILSTMGLQGFSCLLALCRQQKSAGSCREMWLCVIPARKLFFSCQWKILICLSLNMCFASEWFQCHVCVSSAVFPFKRGNFIFYNMHRSSDNWAQIIKGMNDHPEGNQVWSVCGGDTKAASLWLADVDVRSVPKH